MEDQNKNIMPEIKIVEVPEWLCRIGRFFTQLHYKGLSDHFQDHPFDAELYDGPDIPPELLQMNQVSDGSIVESER